MEAIDILKGVQYEGDCYEEKIQDWLDIAAYAFEINDPTVAEQFVKNKIAHIVHHTTDNDKIMRYRMCYAKVQDSNRDFQNASQEYYKASNLPGVDADAIEELIDCTLKTTILSPSGPQKARLLAILYNDERAKSN